MTSMRKMAICYPVRFCDKIFVLWMYIKQKRTFDQFGAITPAKSLFLDYIVPQICSGVKRLLYLAIILDIFKSVIPPGGYNPNSSKILLYFSQKINELV